MAEFLVTEETATKLILKTDPSNVKQPVGCFAFLVLIVVIISTLVYVFLNQTLGWVFFFLTGCLAILLIYKKIYPTTKHIIFDLDSGKVSRFNSVGKQTKKSTETLLSEVSKIMYVFENEVASPHPSAAVLLFLENKSSFLVNFGTPAEMKPFAEKIVSLLNRPFEEHETSNSKEFGDYVY